MAPTRAAPGEHRAAGSAALRYPVRIGPCATREWLRGSGHAPTSAAPHPVLFLMIATAGLLPASGRAATTCPGFDVLHDDAVGGSGSPPGPTRWPRRGSAAAPVRPLHRVPRRLGRRAPAPVAYDGAGQRPGHVHRRRRAAHRRAVRRPAERRRRRAPPGQRPRVRATVHALPARPDRGAQAEEGALLHRPPERPGPDVHPGRRAARPLPRRLRRHPPRRLGRAAGGRHLRSRRDVLRLPARAGPTHGGGGGTRFPTKTSRCPATFTVLHADHVRALKFPAGPYWVSILKGSNITCPQSAQLFASFLARTDGRLPKPWVIDVASGSFTRGRGSRSGFVTKPAFRVR